MLFDLINEKIETNNRTYDSKLELPFQPFPYYEGMNKMGVSEYWLGLYWRNNEYDLAFLKEFCDIHNLVLILTFSFSFDIKDSSIVLKLIISYSYYITFFSI